MSKVTIYIRGEFMGNIIRVEATSASVKVRPYAQYSAAVHCEFIPKRARKARGFVQSYKPSLLILEGWDHPEPDGIFETVPALPEGAPSDAVVTQNGRYSCCDSRWQSDFDTKINAYIAQKGVQVLHDFRGHDPYNAVAQVPVLV